MARQRIRRRACFAAASSAFERGMRGPATARATTFARTREGETMEALQRIDDRRLERLETEVRRMRAVAIAAVIGAVAFVGLASFRGAREDVLHVRGIVVEDAAGKPRVLIGAPVPNSAQRKRTDAASGIVILGEDGLDRLQLGLVGAPQMGGKVQPRIAAATGLMVCDPAGNERAGFGYLANGQVGWGLDYDGQEAIVAAVIPDQHLAGILINTETQDSNPTRLALMSTRDGASLRLSDSKGVERAAIEVGGLGAPVFKLLDEKGELVRDALKQP
jgi:hypothetical protein